MQRVICPECGASQSTGISEKCLKCGCEFENEIPENKPETEEAYSHSPNEVERYFSFDKMISKRILEIIYLLGMAGLCYIGVVMIYKGATGRYASANVTFMGLGILVFGNLVWRLLCEVIAVLFKIFTELVAIREKL